MRRLLVICLLGAAIFAAFAVGRIQDPVMAGSTGALTLRAATPASGCPLGPTFVFCGQLTGGTTVPAQFTLTASSTVSGIAIKLAAVAGPSSSLFAAGDFTVEGTTCGASLAAGASCTISVSLTPSSGTRGPRAAALTVTDSTKDTAIVNLSGAALNNATGGSSSAIGFTPPPAPACPQDNAFTFCPQAVHATSGPQSFLLTTGATVTGLSFSIAAVPGLASEFALSDFAIVPGGCGTTLTMGSSCDVSVQFTPSTTGTRAATLTATDAGGDSTVIYLAGSATSGLAITPGAPGARGPACSPGNTFVFCNTPEGGAESPTAFTLTNTSGVQLTGVTIPAATTGGDFKLANTTCLATLPANSSCTVNIQFSPATTGLLQEPFVIIDTDGDVATANLAGTGDNYLMALAPTQPPEVSVAQGGTVGVVGQVIPDAVFGLDGEQVTFGCPATVLMPINTSCVVTPCPAAITPGTPANFTATFVTSTAVSVAPLPPTGCSSYGPAPATAMLVPHPRSPGNHQGLWRFPSGIPLALLAALALGLFAVSSRRRPQQTIFAAAALVAALLTGCHHGSAVSSATPLGMTDLNISGIALDANGNSLGTSRTIVGVVGQGFIIDVIQSTGNGGGGGGGILGGVSRRQNGF